MIADLHEITDCAETKALLIENLISRAITGPEFLKSLDAETKHPILLLEHTK
ncbi:hypothetical protein D3C75_1247840 [compost metagenome]